MYATMILGAGPGGTGPLVWAAQNEKLDAWLAAGVAILDRQPAIGGTLGRYLINSDSLGAVYMECLQAPAAQSLFARLRHDPATHVLEPLRHAFPPLALVDRYLRRLGSAIEDAVARSPSCDFLPETGLRALHLRPGGIVAAEIVAPDGRRHFVEARTAILALGGHQAIGSYLDAELLPDIRLPVGVLNKIVSSDDLLTSEGLSRAAALLDRSRTRRAVILGGSHSAFSVAWVLTTRLPDRTFGQGEIAMLMRRPPRIFYESAEHAKADGYGVTDADICPRTQRVNRLGGLRGDGREVWRRLTRRPGSETEARIAMMPLREPDMPKASLRQLLADAALIVPAFGYRARTVPLFGTDGRRLKLSAEQGGSSVGPDARILLADGSRVPNLFGIGLGSGYVPLGSMGGEASFTGQANSLWFYQNDIGGVVYRGVHECLDRAIPWHGRRHAAAPPGAMPLPVPGV